MKLIRTHSTCLAAALIIIIIFGTMYTVGQQILRLNANDPQMQLAEDAATALTNTGIAPSSETSGHVEIASSLAPFVIIYDKNGKVVNGNGYLNGTIPTLPLGVLQHATAGHDNWVTWQPQRGVRVAVVATAADNYYVVSGRSLRETEVRENVLLELSALGWIGSLIVVAIACVVKQPPRTLKRK